MKKMIVVFPSKKSIHKARFICSSIITIIKIVIIYKKIVNTNFEVNPVDKAEVIY